MAGWAALAGYVIAYDVWASRTARPTLSAHARRLDTRPAARFLAVSAGLLVLNHLFGTRRPW